jgi:hypothetical protein
MYNFEVVKFFIEIIISKNMFEFLAFNIWKLKVILYGRTMKTKALVHADITTFQFRHSIVWIRLWFEIFILKFGKVNVREMLLSFFTSDFEMYWLREVHVRPEFVGLSCLL